MSPPGAAKALTNRPVRGAFFCDALANRRPSLEHKLYPERVAEKRDLWFSGL